MMKTQDFKLTQYSHGAGCGCKIAPDVLELILGNSTQRGIPFESLLVGNSTNDDAAVMAIDDENCLISTTDFFTPIVDDALLFGQIAGVNAISDVYAMGGKPLMAIAILGWPVNQLPNELAGLVVEGGRLACARAGIPLAGGHSIDLPEPIFGLAVTGTVLKNHIKYNSSAKPGDWLYLTKPLGIGLISTAQKKNLAKSDDMDLAIKSMLELNDLGYSLARLDYVNAMTDVTGFGLAGHLLEMCRSNNLKALLSFDKIPVFPFVDRYIELECQPGGTNRNLKAYGQYLVSANNLQKMVLADPQTSGGLLVAVANEKRKVFEDWLASNNLAFNAIGQIESNSSKESCIEVSH